MDLTFPGAGGCWASQRVLRVLATLLRDVLTDDLRQPQRAGTGIIAVRKNQVKVAPALTAFAQRQRFELAAVQFAAHRVLRKPCKPQAHDRRVNLGGLLAHRPALLRAEPAAAAALAAGIADDQVTILPQILQVKFAPESMQRMVGVRGSDEAYPHQRIPREAGRYLRADGQINLAL